VRRGAKPPRKCIGHRLKLLDILQKFWAPLRKLFAPPGDPSWYTKTIENIGTPRGLRHTKTIENINV